MYYSSKHRTTYYPESGPDDVDDEEEDEDDLDDEEDEDPDNALYYDTSGGET